MLGHVWPDARAGNALIGISPDRILFGLEGHEMIAK